MCAGVKLRQIDMGQGASDHISASFIINSQINSGRGSDKTCALICKFQLDEHVTLMLCLK